jgi:hypothetical protein
MEAPMARRHAFANGQFAEMLDIRAVIRSAHLGVIVESAAHRVVEVLSLIRPGCREPDFVRWGDLLRGTVMAGWPPGWYPDNHDRAVVRRPDRGPAICHWPNQERPRDFDVLV